MADAEEIFGLRGQRAVDKWLEGRDAWNAWVDEHPEEEISFSGFDFTKYEKFRFKDLSSLMEVRIFLGRPLAQTTSTFRTRRLEREASAAEAQSLARVILIFRVLVSPMEMLAFKTRILVMAI